MRLSVLGVIAGVYWYCCFQSSICGEQSLLIPTWIQPFVSQTSRVEEVGGYRGGDRTRQPLWFATGLRPALCWPCPKQVAPPPSTTSPRPLSLLSFFSFFLSLFPLSLFFIFPSTLVHCILLLHHNCATAYTCEAHSGLRVRSLQS